MDFCTYEFFHYETRLMQLKLQIPDFVIYKEKIMGNFMIVSGENYWTIFEKIQRRAKMAQKVFLYTKIEYIN